MCVVEVSRAGRTPVSEIRSVPKITDGVGRCPEDDWLGALARCGVAYQFAQDWRAWFFGGGHLVAAISTNFAKRLYPALDAADKETCRPDFGIALYPGHMRENTSKDFELNPYIPVTKQTPLTFLLQAEDDPIDTVKNSLVYYGALRKVGVPVEMHLYAHGGHGFGLRRTKFPITGWAQLVETWLATIGMISE